MSTANDDESGYAFDLDLLTILLTNRTFHILGELG